MDSWSVPPWSRTADEEVAANRSAFRNCEEAVKAFATRGNGKISNETYTISKTWGKMLRAKVSFVLNGRSATMSVACWSASPPKVEMFVKVDER